MNNTEWIAIKDRAPTISDFPIWMWSDESDQLIVHDMGTFECYDDYTHWVPVEAPPAPPQVPLLPPDERAFNEWVQSASNLRITPHNAWHAALAWERKRGDANNKTLSWAVP